MTEVSIKKAVGMTAIAKYTTILLQFIFTAILSRLLTPDQYGTIAVVMVFVVFFQMFSDMGFASAVIQNKTLTKVEIDGIFTITVIMGLFLGIGFCGFSFLIASFYEDEIFIPIGFLLSISIFFNTLNTIPNAILLRNKKFGIIAVRTVVVYTIVSLFTILLAFKGRGVYALVFQAIFSAIAIFTWNEVNAKLKIRFKGMFAAIKKVLGYSIFQFGAMSLNYFNRNLDQLLIGKFFNRDQLGYYNKSYSLMGMIIHNIPGVINPALQPILSEHQDNPKYIYDRYMNVLHILSFIGCFVAAFCAANAKEIILIIFGSQWEQAVLPLQLFSISIGFQLLTNTFGAIFQSLGNTKLMFQLTIYNTIIICGCIVAGSVLGSICYVAAMVSVGYLCMYFLSFYILVEKAFGFSYKQFLCSFRGDLFVFILLMTTAFILPSFTHLLAVDLIIKTAVIGVIFLGGTYYSGSLKLFLQTMFPRRFGE